MIQNVFYRFHWPIIVGNHKADNSVASLIIVYWIGVVGMIKFHFLALIKQQQIIVGSAIASI